MELNSVLFNSILFWTDPSIRDLIFVCKQKKGRVLQNLATLFLFPGGPTWA